MRKFITTMLIAAAAFTACVQNDDFNTVVTPDNNKITFTAKIDLPQTRTVLVEEDGNYHAEWQQGDVIFIYQVKDNSSRTNEKFTLTEDCEQATISATFNAATATNQFHYIMCSPTGSMNGACEYMAFDGISANQTPKSMNTFDGGSDFILSKAVERTTQPADETIVFENTRISSFAKVSVLIPELEDGDAIKSVTFACDQPIAGKITNVMLTDIIAGTNPLAQHSHSTTIGSVTVNLPETQTSNFSYYMCVWPETIPQGDKVTITLITNEDRKYVKEITLPKAMTFAQGDMLGFTVNMEDVEEFVEQTYEPIEGTVNVAGIYWALGNLEYEKDGTTDTGFAEGWRIAPSQYHHFHIGKTGNLTSITDYNKVAHFNFGGIEDSMTAAIASALHLAATTPAFDFSGKMYTDATCATATTDYAEAKFGDIAFWASKGKYRMPTEAEFAQLHAKACYMYATYKDGENTINGAYFYNPGVGETAGPKEGTKEVTSDDLQTGLFLPFAGRTYNNTDYRLYNVNAQCIYRTSTVDKQSVEGNGFGVLYRSIFSSDVFTSGYFTDAGTRASGTHQGQWNYGATGRYAIRPVYNVK